MYRLTNALWNCGRDFVFWGYALTVLQCVIVLVLLLRSTSTDRDDPRRCQSFMKDGRWSHEPDSVSTSPTWIPFDCVLHSYKPLDIQSCLSIQPLRFRGDSTIRKVFWATTKLLDSTKAEIAEGQAEKHADVSFKTGGNNITFYWDGFLNRSDISQSTHILGTGFWYLRYLTEADDRWHRWEKAIYNATQSLESHTTTYILPIIGPVYDRLDVLRRSTITEHDVSSMNSKLKELEINTSIEVAWTFDSMAIGRAALFDKSGLHVKPWIASIQANILLNKICNPILRDQSHPLQSNCCVKLYVHVIQKLFFLFILGFWFIQTIRRIWFMIRIRYKRKTYAVPPTARSYMVTEATGTFLLALLYCFVADRTFVYPKTTKILDVPAFLTLLSCFLLLGLFTVRQTSHDSIKQTDSFLSRSQTEEWKGWMQGMILLYHYFNMSKVLWVYQIVRVLVGAYLFLTGYGHTLYFLKTGGVSLKRMASVLIRLNLLSWGLSLIMGNGWDFYYFPVLASFWFGVTSLMVAVGLQLKQVTKRILLRWILLIVLITSLVAALFMIYKSSIQSDATSFGLDRHGAAPYEFYFRVCLDRYAPFAGMLLAFIRHKIRQDQIDFLQRKSVMFVLTITAVILTGFYFWLIGRFTNKYEYNQWHPVISIAPILAYVTIRNCCKILRTHHCSLFAWLGRCSLETFVLQYHIWLAIDTKGLLHLGLLDRPDPTNTSAIISLGSWKYWLEKAIITAIFLLLSHKTAKATSVLTAALTSRK